MRIRSVLIVFPVILLWSCSDFDEEKFIVDDIHQHYFNVNAYIEKDSNSKDTISNKAFGREVKKLYPDSIFIKPISENRDFVELFPGFYGNSKINSCYHYFFEDRLDSIIIGLDLNRISQFYKRQLIRELGYGRILLGGDIQNFPGIKNKQRLKDLDFSNFNIVIGEDTLSNYSEYIFPRPFNLGDCYLNKDRTRMSCYSVSINRNGEYEYYGGFYHLFQFGKWRNL